MNTAVETVRGKTLLEQLQARKINEAQWVTLKNSLYPGAKNESVLAVIDYCIARQLDPLKKPCHIVPMEVKDAASGQYAWRDVVMPGIYEYRTTAHRTGKYLGHSIPDYGPMVEAFGVKAPEWCSMIVRRQTDHGVAEFPVKVFFSEVVGLREGKANKRWKQAPIQMLTKCTEAAGLREAFPDEFGGEMTAEEMDGRTIIGEAHEVAPGKPLPPKPEKFENWIADMGAAAETGTEALTKAWEASEVTQREYLTAAFPGEFERLKGVAADADKEAAGSAT